MTQEQLFEAANILMKHTRVCNTFYTQAKGRRGSIEKNQNAHKLAIASYSIEELKKYEWAARMAHENWQR